MLAGYLAGRLDEGALARKLGRLARDIDLDRMERPPTSTEVQQSTDLTVRTVFDHWLKRMSKDARTKLTDGRRRVILARLKEGYSVQQMLQAIDGCAGSEFHMGENDRATVYNDLTHILRNGEKLEQFTEKRTEQDPTEHEDAEVKRLRRLADEAMRNGDTDVFNAANTQLSDRLNAGGRAGTDA